MRTDLSGNSAGKAETEKLLRSSLTRAVAVSGPTHLGKKTFSLETLQEILGDEDVCLVEAGIDGAREAKDFCSSCPVFGSRRAVVVDDADLISDAAQDAYLKLCEEPPAGSLVVLILEDHGFLSEALQSRLQGVVRWSRLSNQEFLDWAGSAGVDSSVRDLCDGRPGLASTVADPSFRRLHSSVLSAISESADPLLSACPDALSGLKPDRSALRSAASAVVRAAALLCLGSGAPSAAVTPFLRLSAVLASVPSANAELQWFRACLAARVVK